MGLNEAIPKRQFMGNEHTKKENNKTKNNTEKQEKTQDQAGGQEASSARPGPWDISSSITISPSPSKLSGGFGLRVGLVPCVHYPQHGRHSQSSHYFPRQPQSQSPDQSLFPAVRTLIPRQREFHLSSPVPPSVPPSLSVDQYPEDAWAVVSPFVSRSSTNHTDERETLNPCPYGIDCGDPITGAVWGGASASTCMPDSDWPTTGIASICVSATPSPSAVAWASGTIGDGDPSATSESITSGGNPSSTFGLFVLRSSKSSSSEYR
nr:hypothetical protein Iba_chr13dCG7400 [Ipomoea batatas]